MNQTYVDHKAYEWEAFYAYSSIVGGCLHLHSALLIDWPQVGFVHGHFIYLCVVVLFNVLQYTNTIVLHKRSNIWNWIPKHQENMESIFLL
jgi:hypothetical protein